MYAFLNIIDILTFRRKLVLVTASIFFAMNVFGFSELALAQTANPESNEIVMPEQSLFPYKKTFIISAYYSPLPNQEYFLTGNYEAEIRLNGNGVHGADGTSVYPGMIAAPKTYPFGTKMEIPGVGTVAVHDRGGAIVEAGDRNNAHDRLDIWMGSGEEGLRRALSWGKKTIEVTVHGINPSIAEAVNLEGLPQAKYIIAQRATPSLFRHSLKLNDHGDEVVKLQRFLKHLEYFDGEITGFFGESTRSAVTQFQIDQDLLNGKDDFNAGTFGVGTRLRLEAIIGREKDKYNRELPSKGLGKGDKGPDVEKLQKILMELGYLNSASGVYDDATIDAVLKFQMEKDIISEETDRGAGYFGPKTESTLTKEFLAEKGTQIEKEYTGPIALADVKYFDRNLGAGDSGPDVTELQEQLKVLNYFKLAPTGYYGDTTVHAVFKLQQRFKLVKSQQDQGAGVFGPQTRAKINELVVKKENTKKLIAAKTLEYNSQKFIAEKEATLIADSSVFPHDLQYGDSGPLVQKLQIILKDLGFFKGHLTSEYFGDTTRSAVSSFQLENKLIDSSTDPVSGVLDAKTREFLNQVVRG